MVPMGPTRLAMGVGDDSDSTPPGVVGGGVAGPCARRSAYACRRPGWLAVHRASIWSGLHTLLSWRLRLTVANSCVRHRCSFGASLTRSRAAPPPPWCSVRRLWLSDPGAFGGVLCRRNAALGEQAVELVGDLLQDPAPLR